MTRGTCGALLITALSTAAPAGAAPALLDRLPGGATVVAYVDMAALRSSPAVAAVDPAGLLSVAGWEGEAFEGLGRQGRFDRAAMGGWPKGEELGVVLFVEGEWDEEIMKRSLLDQGAVEIRVAGSSAYKLPRDEDGDDFVVTLLEPGRLAVSSFELSERVRAQGGAPHPVLAEEIAALPSGLSAWILAAEPGRAGAARGLDAGAAGMAEGLRSLGLWIRAKDSVQVGATALAADSASATQLGAVIQFGLLALSSQEAGPAKEILGGLRFENSGERLNLGLELSAAQLRSLLEAYAPAITAASSSGASAGR